MEISAAAKTKIQKALEDNPGKFPRLVLKRGGCAGNMLVLLLEEPDATDVLFEANEIKFAITPNAMQFIDDISIELKTGLCDEIVVRNTALRTCRCGKSFVLPKEAR